MSSNNPPKPLKTPFELARFFLEHGDVKSALELCELWKERNPDDPKIGEIEKEAKETIPRRNARPAYDEVMAETFLLKGYLEEAFFIYRRLAFKPDMDAEIYERMQLLAEVVAFRLPDDAPVVQVRAEEQLRRGKLAVALIIYHEIADRYPDNASIRTRRDQLRAMLGEVPQSERLGTAEHYETIRETPEAMTILLEQERARLEEARARNKERLALKTRKDIDRPEEFENYQIPDELEQEPQTEENPTEDEEKTTEYAEGSASEGDKTRPDVGIPQGIFEKYDEKRDVIARPIVVIGQSTEG